MPPRDTGTAASAALLAPFPLLAPAPRAGRVLPRDGVRVVSPDGVAGALTPSAGPSPPLPRLAALRGGGSSETRPAGGCVCEVLGGGEGGGMALASSP